MSKYLGIVQKLPEPVLNRFDEGDLSIEAAYGLSRIADDEELVLRLGSQRGFDDKWLLKDIDRELKRRENERAHAAKLAELEAAGVTIVDHGAVFAGQARGLCGEDNEPLGQRNVWLAMSVDDHAGFECHGADLDEHSDAVFWVCTDPAAHPEVAWVQMWGLAATTVDHVIEMAQDTEDDDDGDGASSTSSGFGQREIDPEDRARFEAAQARAVERREFLTALLAEPFDDEVFDAWPVSAACAWNVVDFVDLWHDEKVTASLLAVEEYEALDYDDEGQMWSNLAAEQPERLALAAALSALEPYVFGQSLAPGIAPPYQNAHYGRQLATAQLGIALVGGYLAWLGRAGYVVNEIEERELQRWLDEAEAEAAADDEPEVVEA